MPDEGHGQAGGSGDAVRMPPAGDVILDGATARRFVGGRGCAKGWIIGFWPVSMMVAIGSVNFKDIFGQWCAL